MSDGVIVKTNIPDFRRQLAELGTRFERRITTRAVGAAARVFRGIAQSFAPKSTGLLESRIYVGRSRESRPGKVVYFVGVRARTRGRLTAGQSLDIKRAGRRTDPFYWRFLEGGWIPRGRGRKFKGGTRRRALERERALKGGASRVSHPFLAPAFKFGETAALDRFIVVMEEGIAKEEARRGGR